MYKNHHTLRMRRRRRKMSLELRTADELYQHHRESLSDSELECSKPVGSSKCQASTRSRSQQRLAQVSTGIAVDCGRQHRRLQCGSVQRMNFDDTTPEELASYFDQLPLLSQAYVCHGRNDVHLAAFILVVYWSNLYLLNFLCIIIQNLFSIRMYWIWWLLK